MGVWDRTFGRKRRQIPREVLKKRRRGKLPFLDRWMVVSCQKRRPCLDNFPIFCVDVHLPTLCSSCFLPLILFIVVHVPSVFSTNIVQHNTHTAHNIHNTQPHTAYNAHNKQHVTSHHITFCTCLVLIVVAMALTNSVLFFCLLVSDFCWIAW